jgi:hypothetical protein
VRDRHLQRLKDRIQDRFELEGIIDDLSEAQAAVKHSRCKLKELCQP